MLQPHSLKVNEDLTYEEEPVAIVDYRIRQLGSETIPTVKVLWRSSNVEEHSWEDRS